MGDTNREIEKKLMREQEVQLGKHSVDIPCSPKMRSRIREEGAKLEQEKDLPNNLDTNEILAILIGRSENFRKRRSDPNIREQMVK